MKYALLIYPRTARETIASLSEDERAAVMHEYRALGQEPDIYSVEQLHPADTATTVRVEDGQTIATDGAFGNEDIAAIFLLDADNIGRALELAARIPAARLGGTVEVRAIVER